MTHPATDHTKYSLTADELRVLLDYDESTGVFTWKANPARPNNWNALYAGKRAGYINFYGRRAIGVLVEGKKRRFYDSVLAWLYMTGEWPGLEIDHKNLDKTDNSWSNLRLASSSQNKFNRGPHRNSTTGIKDVFFDKNRNKYVTCVSAFSASRHVGRFDTIEEATAARDAACKRLHGNFVRLA